MPLFKWSIVYFSLIQDNLHPSDPEFQSNFMNKNLISQELYDFVEYNSLDIIDSNSGITLDSGFVMKKWQAIIYTNGYLAWS